MAQPQSITDLKDTGVTVAPEDIINEILPFCAQGQEGRDLLSQAEYAQDMQRNIGHQPGIARAQLANKQARQVSHMAAGLAQFLARRYAPGVVDDGDLDKVEAALVAALDAVISSPTHLATLLRAGLMRPDGKTATVDEDGVLSALGGNLLLNDEIWITESGDFEVPYDGVFELLIIDGGSGAYVRIDRTLGVAGDSGNYGTMLVRLKKGDEVSVTIGAGGLAQFVAAGTPVNTTGGRTYFGEYSAGFTTKFRGEIKYGFSNAEERGFGGGFGGGSQNNNDSDGKFYGAGGGFYSYLTTEITVGKGKQGAVRLRGWNPAKATGPLPEPVRLSARRMAARAAAEPVTVNLYDSETGQGSVWREEDAEAKLAEGLITQEAWQEICAARAAEDYAAWLANPETEAERFGMFRAARDAKLAETDYLMTPDYPLTDEQRAAVTAYRQALRDLPAQEGAPWDGGGELTPWPEVPTVAKVQEV